MHCKENRDFVLKKKKAQTKVLLTGFKQSLYGHASLKSPIFIRKGVQTLKAIKGSFGDDWVGRKVYKQGKVRARQCQSAAQIEVD